MSITYCLLTRATTLPFFFIIITARQQATREKRTIISVFASLWLAHSKLGLFYFYFYFTAAPRLVSIEVTAVVFVVHIISYVPGTIYNIIPQTASDKILTSSRFFLRLVAVSHLKSVLFEPVRSADPPISSGTASAMALMSMWEYLRDPWALSCT